MPHQNYFEIQADSHRELGLKQGRMFGEFLRDSLNRKKQVVGWEKAREQANEYLNITKESFPKYIEELEGYADAAGAEFMDLWTLALEDEINYEEKCTTVITNDGKLFAHNEDWNPGSQNNICILKKTIKDITIFELFYLNTLGGNSISINSHGIIQAINTLIHADRRSPGIPKNIISRWLSETASPEKDSEKFKTLRRASGHNHNFADLNGNIWNLESTATQQVFSKVKSPFVHANHYITELKEFEKTENKTHTFSRHDTATEKVSALSNMEELRELMSDESQGPLQSIFNERTIARMIVDVESLNAFVWLKRESELGWVRYALDFLK